MNWTDSQRKAIDHGGNLLVAAAAGSGKTAVLTERVARLIQNGAQVEDFLVVTFTRAAAAEMKKRIAARLFVLAQSQNGEDATRLNAAAAGIGSANISTIDAFCTHVLRRHFHAAGLDPAFRAADETESTALRQDVMDELLEQKYASEGFVKLTDLFGKEKNFIESAFRLYDFLCAQPEPLPWLERAAQAYEREEAELAESPAVREITQGAQRALRAKLDVLHFERDCIAGAFPSVAAILDETMMRLGALLLPCGYAGYGAMLQSADFPRLIWPRGTEESIKDGTKNAWSGVKDIVKKQRRTFSTPLSQRAAQLQTLAPFIQELYSFIKDFFALYAERKRQEGVIDYSDMEHMTLSLLKDPAVAREYREKFKYIFVDEYQDSNPVQECLINAIKRPDNLFLVGDVKQSIYRFRMAEPGLFLEKYQTFRGETGVRVDLSSNFRSTGAVIDAVNAIFSNIMQGETGEIAYDEDARLIPGREAAGKTELHILQRAGFDDDAEPLMAAEAEARYAAERIHQLVGTDYTDPKTGEIRKLRYGDIVILHSAPKPVSELWLMTLAQNGVPAYAETSGGYFEAVEVQIFLNLLRVIDNRRQDIPLLSVLRSPIGGFSTEELIALGTEYRSETYFDALKKAAQTSGQLGEKAAELLYRLDRWRADAALYGLAEFLGMLLEETGYSRFVSALPGGSSRKGNLEALLHSAEIHAKNGRGLDGYLRFMDRVKETDTGRMGIAQTGSANVVRLISIHRSKGLEFPIVFLAGLSKQFNAADRSADLIFDAELGVGFRPVWQNTRMDTLFHQAIASRGWRMSVAEQMRVLYVGMTRAAEQLILLCAVKDIGASVKKYRAPLTPARCADATCFADWVLGTLMHRPDGNPLREAAGLLPLPGVPQVEVVFHENPAAQSAKGAPDEEMFSRFIRQAEGVDCAAYCERFRWQYPHEEDTRIPSKLGVSELLGNPPEAVRYPKFLRGSRPLTVTDIGGAVHALMEHISLIPHDADSVAAEIAGLTASGILTEAQAAAISIPAVVAFFRTDLGRRLIASERAERELAFHHPVAADALIGAGSSETILLQGIIDCCFLDGGQWVLLDYKTDYVPEGRGYEVAMRHQKQLLLYANALCALSGIPVKEMFVYLFKTGECISIPVG